MADKINTGGGLVNEGDIDAGGDFIGRDRNDHRWDNRRGTGGESNVNVNVGHERRQQGESPQSWIERALAGDQFTGTPGLIKDVRELNMRFSEFVRKDEEWKRNFSESSRAGAGKQAAVAWLAFGLLALIIAIYLISISNGI